MQPLDVKSVGVGMRVKPMRVGAAVRTWWTVAG